MKTFFCCLILAASCLAQTGPSKPFSLTGTQCGSVAVDGKSTVAFQVLGSWSGTIQPSVAVDGQATANNQVTPVASTTPQSTVTGNGAFTANVAGYSTFTLCGNTITGTAKIFLNVSKYVH